MNNPISTLAVSDTGFVFDPRTGHTYAVNATGLAVLRGLKAGSSVAEVERELARDFEQASAVDADLQEFLKLLVELGLLSSSELSR